MLNNKAGWTNADSRPGCSPDGWKQRALPLRQHRGYDHGHWFIQRFAEDHLRWHHARL
jgi:hypothetical protein